MTEENEISAITKNREYFLKLAKILG